jgi:hypothetical protein
MESLGSLLYFIWNTTLCVTFWCLIPKIAKDRQTPQVVSYVSLSCGFVLLTLLSVHVVNLVFGSTSGGFEHMGLAIFSVMGTFLLSPLMVTAGAIRLVGQNRKKRVAGRALQVRHPNASIAHQVDRNDVVNYITATCAILGASWIAFALFLLLHGTVPGFKTVVKTWPFPAVLMLANAILIVKNYAK